MIVLHVVFTGVKDNVLSQRVNIQIAVFGAYRAIAVHGFLAFEGGNLALVLNGTAMATGFVPYLLGGL